MAAPRKIPKIIENTINTLEINSGETPWTKWLKTIALDTANAFLPNSKALAENRDQSNQRVRGGIEVPNYQDLSTKHAIMAAQKLRNAEVKDFVNFYYSLGQNRNEIAEILEQEERETCGKKRKSTDDLVTPIRKQIDRYGDQYESLLAALLAMAGDAKLNENHVRIKKQFGIRKEFLEYPYETPIEVPYHTLTVEILQNSQVLTTITVVNLLGETINGLGKDREYIWIDHLRGAKCEEFLATQCAPIFKQIQDWKPDNSKTAEENEKNFYYLLGLLQWHLAQATPLLRGSCATSDILLKALLLSKEFPPRCFKPGVNWDFRGMSTCRPEEYAELFYHLFENTPPIPSDKFIPNPAASETFHRTLQSAWMEEQARENKTNHTSAFQHQNLRPSVFNSLYSTVEVNSEYKSSSIHHLSYRRFALAGGTDIKKSEQDWRDALKLYEKGIADVEKLKLLRENDNFLGVWLAIQRDLVGDSFDARRRFADKADTIEWINEKSMVELLEICKKHDQFNESLKWIESLSPSDRSLLNESRFTSQQIANMGLKGLQQELDAMKGVEIDSKRISLGLFVPAKNIDDAKASLNPEQLAQKLLKKLKYRTPPSYDSHMKKVATEWGDASEAVRFRKIIQASDTHKKIMNTLEKISTKKSLDRDDLANLEKAQQLFLSLEQELSRLLSEIKSRPDFKAEVGGP